MRPSVQEGGEALHSRREAAGQTYQIAIELDSHNPVLILEMRAQGNRPLGKWNVKPSRDCSRVVASPMARFCLHPSSHLEMTHSVVLVLDYGASRNCCLSLFLISSLSRTGSQYTQLIARRIREIGAFSMLVPGDVTMVRQKLEHLNHLVLILNSLAGTYQKLKSQRGYSQRRPQFSPRRRLPPCP